LNGIEELNRQDAKFAEEEEERKRRKIREFSIN
jgi:hypothetical protein